MKTILALSILFCAIALPALGQLIDADLDKIRLIVNEIVNESEKRVKAEVKEELTTINTKIEGLDTRLRNVETGIAELRGSNIAFLTIKDWIVVICAVAAIIISIVALRKKSVLPPTPQGTQKVLSQ